MKARHLPVLLASLLLAAAGCRSHERQAAPSGAAPPAPAPSAAAPPAAANLPESLPRGLLVALSQFAVENGKVVPKPGAARLEMVVRRGGAWHVAALEDPASNVFHKAMVYTPPGEPPGILTLGGNAAAVKLWRHEPQGFVAETLWQTSFGGQQNRMREGEIADVYGDGRPSIVVATHDQGVVAVIHPKSGGGYETRELDRQKDTFVHEIEIGDLDGDGVLEVYATPSEPNRVDGTPQSGKVVRYVPAKGEGRQVVADLGERHAKEILVGDVDGDGRDELYVSVEGTVEEQGGRLQLTSPVEIRRYDAGTDPRGGVVIAKIEDRFCRFLTAGDVDGDGKKEMVAATFQSGLWLLRPGADAHAPWSVTSIDRDSSGFEHAALLTDLDGDGRDELYVASDDQGELRRYVWQDGHFEKQVILRRPIPGQFMTWNLMPVPAELVP